MNANSPDQLSAMPSVHVIWAVIVGYTVWRVSPSRWRWIGPAHTVMTILVVVVTANHYLATASWASPCSCFRLESRPSYGAPPPGPGGARVASADVPAPELARSS